jgi:hypothetical protein
MKVVKVARNILIVQCRQEPEDKEYGSCLWADFLFDCDEYRLNVNSDCGNYSYVWHITPTEPFLELMHRMNREYLLDKISKKIWTDVPATIKNMTAYVNNLTAGQEILEDEKENLLDAVLDCVNIYNTDYSGCVERLYDIIL